MCGINGLFGLEDLSDPRSILTRMNKRLSHRGPDASGIQLFNNSGLGHKRLSIIDLSSSADQPMVSSCGRFTIVYNGELYNFKEIRQKLDGHLFVTESDTEVILNSYKEWGTACLQLFNGMFAFAIWDAEKEEMFIARDRVGIKPLYYAVSGSTYLFSSEIRALIASELFTPTLDKESLDEYLAYQTIHSPRTILKDVKMLSAGHYMVLSDTEVSIRRYWSAVDSRVDSSRASGNEIKRAIKEKLYSSVESRMISDVPFGAFLSGGIDSSIMVGLMSQASAKQISTFSVSFDETEFSEATYARIVSKKFRTAHEEIRLTPKNFLELLPEALLAMDHPSGDGPNTYIVSKVTKEAGITVAISGLGGDELFAGYEHFKYCHSALTKQWISQYPMVLRRLIAQVIRLTRPGVSGVKAAQIMTSLRMNLAHVYPIMREVLQREERNALLKGKSLENPLSRRIQDMNDEWSQLPILSQVTMAEIDTYMRDVLLRDADQMSMANALEVRVPFLDHELIELVLGVRDEVKYPQKPKALLIDSLDGLIPNEIIDRPKMGFTLPWVNWMKNELREFCEIRLSRLAQRDILDADRLTSLWQRFIKNDPMITWSRIWPLIVLENWIEENNVQT
ncbi:MAG: asparagine synthase (glutamine-hydrolyzing) [Flavobacteriales bacterium]|nr:asparagine synthase (glutamine-hydrolyzing) [Flavobacteriales bacterium]